MVPLDFAQPDNPGQVAIVDPVAPGSNVHPCGVVAPAGAIVAAAGTRLAIRQIGMLAAADFLQVPVIRRPRMLILLANVPPPPFSETNVAMVSAAFRGSATRCW